MIGKRGGGNNHALLRAVAALGGGKRGNDLHRFAKTHFIGQNAAHARFIEAEQPARAALLVVLQLALQAGRHIFTHVGLGFAQGAHGGFHLGVGLGFGARQAQHADHVGRTVCAKAELARFSVRMGIIQRGGVQKLLHNGRKAAQVAHVQEFTGFQAHILLPLGNRLQNGQHLGHGLALLQQRKHQPAAAHAEGRFGRQPARLHLFKGGGGVDFAQLGQLAHALRAEGENIARTFEHNAPAAHGKARVGEEIEQRAFRAAVAQKQSAVLQRGRGGADGGVFILLGLVLHGPAEGIQHRVSIAEFHARLHIAIHQIQIGRRLERGGNQPCAQLRRGRDGTHSGQRGQKRGQRILRIAGGIAEATPFVA